MTFYNWCRLAFVAGLLAARLTNANDVDDPSVTPYRPTVSNPADLSAPGWLEMEIGGLSQEGSDSLPYLLKYAFNENSGLLLGGQSGNTFLEWKQRFQVQEGMSFGIEAGVQTGTNAYIVNGIYSVDLETFHLDLNYGGIRYTQLSQWQTTWAAAISRPINDKFGAAFEVSDQAGYHQTLEAINYNLSKRCVLDFGITQGIDHGGSGLFVGGTFLVGRLK